MRVFDRIAPFYDGMMQDIDYDGWIDYLVEVMKKKGFKGRKILDLACGTGNSSIPLKKYGYDVVGIDISLSMLREAGKKGVSLVYGDARVLPFKDSSFDGVISIFDSLNYIMDDGELLQVFRSVRRVLKEGGIFLFDMNTPFGLRMIALQGDEIREGEDFFSVWRHSYDEETKEITLHLVVFERNGRGWIRYDEVHREKGRTKAEVFELLEHAGFSSLSAYVNFTFRRPDGRTKRILYVAS